MSDRLHPAAQSYTKIIHVLENQTYFTYSGSKNLIISLKKRRRYDDNKLSSADQIRIIFVGILIMFYRSVYDHRSGHRSERNL